MTKNIIKLKKDEPIQIELENDSILKNGYGLISRDIMRDKTIHSTAKVIYSYLNSFAGSKGIAYPTLSLMQFELNLSKNTVNKYIKELKEKGLIKVFRIQNEENNLLSNNVYQIGMNYSTIEENKKEHSSTAKKKNVPSDKSEIKFSKDSITQRKDIVQEILKSEIFTLEEVSKMSVEKINYAYELIQKIKGK